MFSLVTTDYIKKTFFNLHERLRSADCDVKHLYVNNEDVTCFGSNNVMYLVYHSNLFSISWRECMGEADDIAIKFLFITLHSDTECMWERFVPICMVREYGVYSHQTNMKHKWRKYYSSNWRKSGDKTCLILLQINLCLNLFWMLRDENPLIKLRIWNEENTYVNFTSGVKKSLY